MEWLDSLAESWNREYPGRDFSSLPPLVRLARVTLLMREYQKRVLGPHDLTPSEYGILGALRRAGRPRQLKPGDLYHTVVCTPGGLTKMLKRLEERGLVQRVSNAADARSAYVRLTRSGAELERKGFSALVESAGELMAPLSPDEIGRVDAALDLLLECFEPEGGAAPTSAPNRSATRPSRRRLGSAKAPRIATPGGETP